MAITKWIRSRRNRSSGSDPGPPHGQIVPPEIRKGVQKQDMFRATLPAGERAATAHSRIAQAKEQLRVLGQRLMRLEDKLLPAAQARVEACKARAEQLKANFEEKKAEYLALERTLRGYFDSHRAVLFVGIAVVLFDGAVLHGILEYSGMTPLTVWLTSLTVPLAIGAANHGFGVLAGAISLRVPSQNRLRFGAVLFAAGVGALVVTFLLLTLFRASAAGAQNEALRALAEGDTAAQLTFFISPEWLGPLQLAGSFAAITMTGLWTMAKHGREFWRLVVESAETDLRQAEATLNDAELKQTGLEERIEQTHQDLEAAALVEHQIDAERHAATVEIDVAKNVLAAGLESEDALKDARTRHEATAEHYFDPEFGHLYTPPTGMAADDRRRPTVAEPSSNGHSDGPIDLKHVTKF